MINDRFKTQLDQIVKQSDQLQDQAKKLLQAGKEESQRILKELGVSADPGQTDMKSIFNELLNANPSVKSFIRNLNVATYDNRFRINWNATMMSAYARHQAEKTYEGDIKPYIDTLKTNVNDQINHLQKATQEWRSKLAD